MLSKVRGWIHRISESLTALAASKNEIQEAPPISIGQNLPNELLWEILFHLLSPIQESNSIRYTRNQGLSSETLHSGYRALSLYSNAAAICSSVCRNWYFVSTRLLYSRPYLGSQPSVVQFLWTMKTQISLRPLVTNLYLGPSQLQGIRTIMPRGSGQSGDLQATYIARIFQLCPGIRALISMSNANDFSPCKTILYHAPRSLRHLILYRNSVQSIFEYNTGAMFPGIEILSLRQSRITLGLETLEVPTLPDLIELNLVQIVFQSSRDLEILVQRVRASAEKLKTVRFLDMEVTNIWDSTALVRVPTPCEDLCLIDFHPFSDSLSTRTSSLHGVRHLTLGVLSPLWKPLTDWDLPDTLETLTLFVEIPQLRDHLAPEVFRMSVIHMSWIYQCLRRNIAAHPSRDSNQLRSVTMNLTGAHSANTVQNAILQESMAELRDLCLANKVSLVERELDVETWATAHLSRHLTNN